MYVATVPLMSMLSVSARQIEVLFSAGVAIFAHISLKISEEMSLKKPPSSKNMPRPRELETPLF